MTKSLVERLNFWSQYAPSPAAAALLAGAANEIERLTAERDAAKAEAERHRMTREEREAISCASWSFGQHSLMNPLRKAYLDRTREGE